MDVTNLISGSSAFCKTSLNIWKFTVHILLKPGLENFEHYFASVWDEYSCAISWTFSGFTFLCDWNENWPFPVLWRLLRPTLATPWTAAYRAPPSIGFFQARVLEWGAIAFSATRCQLWLSPAHQNVCSPYILVLEKHISSHGFCVLKEKKNSRIVW